MQPIAMYMQPIAMRAGLPDTNQKIEPMNQSNEVSAERFTRVARP